MRKPKKHTHQTTKTDLSNILDRFEPAVTISHKFISDVKGQKSSTPIHIATERPNKSISRFDTVVCTTNQQWLTRSTQYIERLVKFLLWSHGAAKVYMGGPEEITKVIQKIYSPTGLRKFDVGFMTRVYNTPFKIITCDLDMVPENNPLNQSVGYQLDGYRVGFDLGASDLKVSAVAEGEPIFSTEIEWNPRAENDPNYHKTHIYEAIQLAASKLPRLDAIGGSAAGVYIDNQPRIASLFRGIPEDKFQKVEKIFSDLERTFGVPFVVINDGEVTALAGAISLNDTGVMGLAMGSSEAVGYINSAGKITDYLNELAFAPIDVSEHAPIDEWSGDKGVGASYLSQQAAFRLAEIAGIEIDPNLTKAGRLEFLQDLLELGNSKAQNIWEVIGVYLGYAIAHYADFYDIKHLLILGRVTSGKGGPILVSAAKRILCENFPELSQKINIQLPDEKSRRVGQSIAAASLPIIER